MVSTLKVIAVTAVMAAVVSTSALGATTTIRYEAEAAGNTLVGCIARSDGNWCSGTGFVGDLGEKALDMVRFNNVSAGVTGEYTMLLAYKTWGTRPLNLVVNGGTAVKLACVEKANNLGSVLQTISLNAGTDNTIELWSDGSAWGPDVDYIDVTGESAVPEPSSMLTLAGLLAPAGMLLRRKRA